MSNLSLERLLFDPADPSSGPNVGSYLRAGTDGDLLSSTNIGGKEALDVNVVEGINVEVDLSSLDDSVAIADASGNYLAINLDGSINASVSATDFDIRDLTHVTDSIKVGDGTDFLAINADGSINANSVITGTSADDDIDTGNPIKVGSRAYDAVSGLLAVSDSGDRADLLSDLYRRIFINDAPNISVASAAVSVASTATSLGTPIDGRMRALVQNNSDKPIYVGPAGVTTSTGLKVDKGATLALEIGQGVALFAVTASGTADTRVFQLA